MLRYSPTSVTATETWEPEDQLRHVVELAKQLQDSPFPQRPQNFDSPASLGPGKRERR